MAEQSKVIHVRNVGHEISEVRSLFMFVFVFVTCGFLICSCHGFIYINSIMEQSSLDPY